MPTVKVEDGNGCELDFKDKLLDVFAVPSDGTTPVTVRHTVIEWTFKPANDTYAEICAEMNLVSLHPVAEAFRREPQLTKVDLSFSPLVRGDRQTVAILKTLAYRPILTEVNLSGNKLGYDKAEMSWIKELASALIHTPNLSRLNLSNNFLSALHLDKISQEVTKGHATSDGKLNFSKLTELNISFNSFPNQNPITLMSLLNSLPYLKKLEASCCDLSSDLFQYNFEDWSERLEKLDCLDVTYNPEMATNSVKAMLRRCSISSVLI